MKTYSTYQEAKIENPKLAVYTDGKSFKSYETGKLFTHAEKCIPADYLMSVDQFLKGGRVFVKGDLCINLGRGVEEVGSVYCWNTPDTDDNERYILKAEALEKETHISKVQPKTITEIKYVKCDENIFDLQRDFEAGNLYFAWVGNDVGYDKITDETTLLCRYEEGRLLYKVEKDTEVGAISNTQDNKWDGEGFPPIGIECNFTPDNTLWGFNYIDNYIGQVLHYEGEQFVFMLKHKQYNIEEGMVVVSLTDKGKFSKRESPQEKAKRERLEAAYDLYLHVHNENNKPLIVDFDSFKLYERSNPLYTLLVDKTNYRKGE